MIASTHPYSAKPSTRTATTPLSTLAFDWVYTVLVLTFTIGTHMDGWSHSTFGPDQSVLSEYHLLFYASLIALGLWLFGAALLNRLEGFEGLNALPAGYTLSAFGVVLFGVTGVFDLGGHALFGFEVDNEALYSPTHLGLFIGHALISMGPARAALKRQQLTRGKESWWTSFTGFLPTLIGWASFFNVMAFVSMTFFGTTAGFMLTEARLDDDYLGQTLGITGIIIQTALTVGVLAWLMLRFKLPAGTFTVFFLLYALYGSVLTFSLNLVPVFVFVGALCDVLYKVVKPNAHPLRYHVFNALIAFVFWAAFYGFVFLTNYGGGIWYTPYIWMGSVTQAVTVALLVSLLSTASSPVQERLEVSAT